jgi:hypothetical protein
MVLALLPVAGTVANEQDDPAVQHLEGNYGLSTVSECLRSVVHPASEVGIDPVTHTLLLPTVTTTQSGSGVMHFFRDGRAQFSGRATEVDWSELGVGHIPSIPGLTLTCSGTQAVSQPGNKLTLLASCTVVQPSSGASFSVTPVQAEGTFSSDRTSIELNEISNQQTINFKFPDGSTAQSDRVCTQRFTLVKLP